MYTMQTDRSSFKRIFNQSGVDCKDELEEKFEKSRVVLNRLVGNVSEREAHDVLMSAVCRDPKVHEDVCLGLLAVILSDTFQAPKAFRDLTLLARDHMKIVIDCLIDISFSKYPKLTELSKTQLIYIIRELVNAGTNNVEMLCYYLMRQIAGGDISTRNLLLAENMLDIFSEHRSWLQKFPMLIANVIYTYLRILEDHSTPSLASLRQKEVNFVVSIIRAHFTDVVMNQQLALGRDFLRLLQSVSRIPEIETLMRDIMYNPTALTPQLTGVHQLLSLRTSRKYLTSRLTPEMEKKVAFLLTQVRFGHQKRYQDWFQKQYLSTPESQTLRADIIRFIVGVIQPTNEMLCSDILPRWAVVGWLLTTCTHPVAAANAKLALFYDWLVYDPNRDNIMNIEPGILVMHHSMRQHTAITATCLDFLVRISNEFWPQGAEKIKEGIGNALRELVEKKVLPNLEVLLDHQNKLDEGLRKSVQGNLLSLVNRTDRSTTPTKAGASSIMDTYPIQTSNGNGVNDVPMSMYSISAPVNNLKSELTFEADVNDNKPIEINNVKFSDEEAASESDDEQGSRNHIGLENSPIARNSPTMTPSTKTDMEKSKIDELVQTLGSNLRLSFNDLINDPMMSTADKSTSLDDILDEYMEQTVDAHERQTIVKCLTFAFKSDFMKPIIPKDSTTLIENLSLPPLNEIVTRLVEIKNEKPAKRKYLLKLLADLVNFSPQLGYRLLIILDQMSNAKPQAKQNQDAYFNIYKNLCQFRNLKPGEALMQDLKRCWEEEHLLVGSLFPIIFTWYQDHTCGEPEYLKVIVSALDPQQLQECVWKIMENEFVIVDNDTLVPLMSRTLDWETWEQHCVWTLVAAQSFEASDFVPLLPQLDYRNNAEAMTYLLLHFKNFKPTIDIISPLLCRKPNPKDRFVISLLLHWSEDDEINDVLADSLCNVMVSSAGSPMKRKRGAAAGRGTASPAGSPHPSLENVLAHLDQLRLSIIESEALDDGEYGVLSKHIMIAAYMQVQQWITDSQKNKYKDLLDLAGEEDESKSSSRSTAKRTSNNKVRNSSPTPTSLPKARTRSGKPKPTYNFDSSESEEEEQVSRPKKRKKPEIESDESD